MDWRDSVVWFPMHPGDWQDSVLSATRYPEDWWDSVLSAGLAGLSPGTLWTGRTRSFQPPFTGEHGSNQGQIWLIKIVEYIGFCVCRGS